MSKRTAVSKVRMYLGRSRRRGINGARKMPKRDCSASATHPRSLLARRRLDRPRGLFCFHRNEPRHARTTALSVATDFLPPTADEWRIGQYTSSLLHLDRTGVIEWFLTDQLYGESCNDAVL